MPATDTAEVEAVAKIPDQRVIGSYTTDQPGPLVLAVGGIHGNEPSGPRAIQAVLEGLRRERPPICGTFLGLTGNLPALSQQRRYINEDLNRCFKPQRVSQVNGSPPRTAEEAELRELTGEISDWAEGFEDVCFVDCHTTSSESAPYISVNAHPPSLSLAEHFPLYSVVGLEQSIPGCFGEYYNKRDYRGFTFEAGQHADLASFENHEALLWLTLVYSGALARDEASDFDHYHQMLARNIVEGRRAFRLAAHYKIEAGEEFAMNPGYVNFGHIQKGETLASNRFGDIHAPCDGRILMPLYQKEGDDGFFVLEEE